MVKFKDFSRPLSVLQVLFKATLTSRTFQDSPVYSSTFQACANNDSYSQNFDGSDSSGQLGQVL